MSSATEGQKDQEITMELPRTQPIPVLSEQVPEAIAVASEAPAPAASFDVLTAVKALPLVTSAAAIANVVFYILLIGSDHQFWEHSPQTLIEWGGNYKPYVLDGQWWRLVTCTFLHANMIHIAANMVVLLDAGSTLERYIGSARFALVFIGTSITAALFSLWSNSFSVSVGSSGAIFGLWGTLLVLKASEVIEFNGNRELARYLVGIIVLNLVLGWTVPTIDNGAHMGGLLGGLVIGSALSPSIRRMGSTKLKVAMIATVSAGLVGITAIALACMPNPMATYRESMDNLVRNEKWALEADKYPTNTNASIRADGYLRGMMLWNENHEILRRLKREHLPEEYLAAIDTLDEYTQDQIHGYELLYYKYTFQTTAYDLLIEQYRSNIKAFSH